MKRVVDRCDLLRDVMVGRGDALSKNTFSPAET